MNSTDILQKLGRIENPNRQQQQQQDPLAQEAAYLIDQLEKMRQAETQNRHQYINSYIGLVTDVAKRLFAGGDHTADQAITAAILFAEALRPRIQEYSVSLVENIPTDPMLMQNIESVEARIKELQTLLMPDSTEEMPEQEIIHAETSSGPEMGRVIFEDEERPSQSRTPEPFTNV